MAISTVLLAYKEAENLKILIPQIKEQLDKTGEDYEIIVVDTAQPLDNTEEVCAEFGARYINQKYPCFGGAFRTGIEAAENDKFLILDSDGSHNPKYIPDLHKMFVSGADVVIGSRYVKGGHTDDAKSSIIMSKILNTTFRIALGIKAKDISTDYRMYDTKQLKKVELSCKNYDILQEVLLKLRINNKSLVIKETPISFDKRMFGESKRRLIPFIIGYIGTLFKLIGIRIRSAFRKKPA
ncbi:MAG: glycosyltransferase [Oscillospiraceae bacterium]